MSGRAQRCSQGTPGISAPEDVLPVVHHRSAADVAVDLSSCDREPIHIPGAVQPHGVLIAVDAVSRRILQISENSGLVLGREPADLLHGYADALVGADAYAALLRTTSDAAHAGDAIPVEITDGGTRRAFDGIAHAAHDGVTIVELEPAEPPSIPALERFFSIVRRGLVSVQEATTVAQVCDVAAREFAWLAGFDRTMVYRFDRDWNGEVVSEQRDDALPPFLGLHYPASDVPRQARELYRRNVLRMIPDARYTPARIVPSHNPLTEAPLDLSGSVLRSVSPIHLEYLANMNVAATLTASLLKHGELWGMIAAHHRTPRFVPYRVRVACEMLARTASLRIAALEEREELAQRLRLRSLQPALLEAVAKDGSFTDAITRGTQMLDVTGAEGAVIKTEGEPILIGRTPRLRHVRRILAWLDERGGRDADQPFISDALALMNPDFAEFACEASGLLAVPLTTTSGGWLLWFRPEMVRTVLWGGDPRKPVAQGEGERISPRRSFEAWKEIVRRHARPWEASQIDAAIELRRLLSDVMMRRAREYAKLNAELARSNQELESFAHIASHDLKEPLRGIANYATFLRDDYAQHLDEHGKEIVDSMHALAKRMASQIDSMLELARVGADEPSGRNTDLGHALDDALALLAPRIAEEHAEIRRAGPLPQAAISPARAREIFINLIGNAIKYNTSDPKIVEIGVSDRVPPPTARGASQAGVPMVALFVRDNGIGIREKHFETVFRMFKRLHAQDRFGGGTGSGLAITRKIVEQNGGVMWVESETDRGSTFFFTVPVSGE